MVVCVVENSRIRSEVSRVSWWLHHFLGTNDSYLDDRVRELSLRMRKKCQDLTSSNSYYFTRRGNVSVPDMYNFHGMYRYSHRYATNWRSVVALIVGFAPPLPGFINNVSLNTINISSGGKHLCVYYPSQHSQLSGGFFLLTSLQICNWLHLLFLCRWSVLLWPDALVSAQREQTRSCNYRRRHHRGVRREADSGWYSETSKRTSGSFPFCSRSPEQCLRSHTAIATNTMRSPIDSLIMY